MDWSRLRAYRQGQEDLAVQALVVAMRRVAQHEQQIRSADARRVAAAADVRRSGAHGCSGEALFQGMQQVQDAVAAVGSAVVAQGSALQAAEACRQTLIDRRRARHMVERLMARRADEAQRADARREQARLEEGTNWRVASRRTGRATIILLAWVALATLSPTPSRAASPWAACLSHAAAETRIHPGLLEAIVEVESQGQAYAFGWREPAGAGRLRSWVAPSRPQAVAFLAELERWRRRYPALHYDVGIAQINSRNLQRFQRAGRIRVAQEALDPCVNLRLAGVVLQEQIDKHGATWRAIAGYNGSWLYVRKVWKAWCRRTDDRCAASPPASTP